jgi:hypothetical protein
MYLHFTVPPTIDKQCLEFDLNGEHRISVLSAPSQKQHRGPKDSMCFTYSTISKAYGHMNVVEHWLGQHG